MKSFVGGLLTIIALGIIGYFVFRFTTGLLSRVNPSPSSSAIALASADPPPTPQPTSRGETMFSPKPSFVPTVKGVSTTKTVTTTTTTSHLTLTLVKTSTCPISYMTEVKDIKGPLTLKYKLEGNTSFGITIWAKDGNELLKNTTYSGNSGQITTISGVTYMKIRVESKSCAGNNDNWLTLTAQR